MDTEKRHAGIVLIVAVVFGMALLANNWKTHEGTIPALGDNTTNRPEKHELVSYNAFITQLFKQIKSPTWVGLLIMQITQDKTKVSADSLKLLQTWAKETGLRPLEAVTLADLAMKDPTEAKITLAARELVFTAAQFVDNPKISDYLFQQGKKMIDLGMAKNPKNVPLRNALITYLSEYENQPMKFLSVLRETLAIDSNNVETNFLHLTLLKKSGQWKKAMQKCQKLISLQPQNTDWLFEASDIYGQQGDSVNAKVFMNLAVKVRKRQEK